VCTTFQAVRDVIACLNSAAKDVSEFAWQRPNFIVASAAGTFGWAASTLIVRTIAEPFSKPSSAGRGDLQIAPLGSSLQHPPLLQHHHAAQRQVD
jgi:hypothetical protein